MFCPKCRTEYREGFNACKDCGSALVAQMPPATDPLPAASIFDPGELVTLLTSTDPVATLLTKASLDAANIWYYETGQSLQHLLPLGFQGAYSGLSQILVKKSDAEAAVAAVKAAAADAERNS